MKPKRGKRTISIVKFQYSIFLSVDLWNIRVLITERRRETWRRNGFPSPCLTGSTFHYLTIFSKFFPSPAATHGVQHPTLYFFFLFLWEISRLLTTATTTWVNILILFSLLLPLFKQRVLHHSVRSTTSPTLCATDVAVVPSTSRRRPVLLVATQLPRPEATTGVLRLREEELLVPVEWDTWSTSLEDSGTVSVLVSLEPLLLLQPLSPLKRYNYS